ncbi:serine/threonine-protein kinase fused [Cylas formicarius]|uniref:serine/threonine-protein kinase fused n=1 Tax=Cylas formicarius TaxID=197179 RepID=UPI0029584570|nr:serine/threonine-protein kinase fused [Cylas formicarius]XP_060529856.1 serine/threonine-protein kinase fused [Cylas formicarius]XP_060529857.1 serine/threonine-protein kinase fused [Cylas formicarius]XP_060529858.1 serine/threonine-protein kinase fused [Cylas formicarius]XP_060529859.1 serine/threonine-protein kinase fused [Cylas formicarius]XP_060529860.1 serine/threonine-protein kinase fused [Cylas formicarius]XP_060529861.1 serine/threonine-protein kinase fused [Cylas formicarius]XP_0
MEEFLKSIKVLGTLGEGSFGKVYKAKKNSNGKLVAVKVISKRGRSTKELKGFRRECEIQRELHHPNIIQMLDSFETENEIFVITEFAHKELTAILSKEGYLPENKVQILVWDLVSALNYLHSNRVLHRDLKPQNILLDVNNKAKLCDFGFARNMSTGTHVLTSIKGTPLYMAPELIDEQPYDHNADLWSLGCIIYELLLGTPPFCTSSILHLIRMIKDEQIQWPTFLSADCSSFLKGLLQKNPNKRMTWEHILNHPFVKGHILITQNVATMPLTQPLSASAQEIKEQQRKESVNYKHLKSTGQRTPESENKKLVGQSKTPRNSNETLKKSTILSVKDHKTENDTNITSNNSRGSLPCRGSEGTDEVQISKCLKEKLNFIEENHPIEADEWIVFLQRSIQEIMNGEMTSLLQPNLTNILVSPLRNSNSNSKVLSYVARLLSVAFVVKGTPEETLGKIKKVYVEVKLVPNLVYASKLMAREPTVNSSSGSSGGPKMDMADRYRTVDQFDSEDLRALECVYMLVCHLVHLQDEFLMHFCDAVAVLNVYSLLDTFLSLAKKRVRIAMDIISIMTHTIRRLPENSELVEKIVCCRASSGSNSPSFADFLRHSDPLMRERICYFLLQMGRCFQMATIQMFWTDELRDTLEALMFDSIESVRNAAEMAVGELKHKDFYKLHELNAG